jgi:hypothetical protein
MKSRENSAYVAVRLSLMPAVVKLVEALPDEVYERLRGGHPRVRFEMANEFPGDPNHSSTRGPSGGPYVISIGWAKCILYMSHGSKSVDAVVGLLAHELGHTVAGHHCMDVVGTLSDEDDLRLQKEADELAAQWGFAEGLRGYLNDRTWEVRYRLREGEVSITPDGERTVRPWAEEERADMEISLQHFRTRIRGLRPSELARRRGGKR